MQDCDNPEGLLVGRIGDQVFADQNEAQGPRSEIRALVAHIGERNHSIHGVNNFRNQPVGGVGTIRRNELPNLVEVNPDFRVEIISDQLTGRGAASGGALFAEMGYELVTGNRFHPTASQVVIAAVEHFARLRHFLEVPGHGVLNQLVGPASALRGEVLELLFRLGGEMYFHAFKDTGKAALRQRL